MANCFTKNPVIENLKAIFPQILQFMDEYQEIKRSFDHFSMQMNRHFKARYYSTPANLQQSATWGIRADLNRTILECFRQKKTVSSETGRRSKLDIKF